MHHNQKGSVVLKKLICIVCTLTLTATMLVHGNAYAIEPGQVVSVEGTKAVVQVVSPNNKDAAQSNKASAYTAQASETHHIDEASTQDGDAPSPTGNTIVVIEDAFLPEGTEITEAPEAPDTTTVVIDLAHTQVALESHKEITEGSIADVNEGSIVLIKVVQGTHEVHHEEHPPQEERRTRRTRDDEVHSA